MYDSYNRVSEEKRPFKTVNQTINYIYKKGDYYYEFYRSNSDMF